MPRLSSQLVASEREVQTAKQTGQRRAEYRVKGMRNLVLRVAPTSKTWSFRYLSPVTGRWRKVSLGSYPAVNLDDAKGQAIVHMAAVRSGKDPLNGQSTSDMTFGQLAEDYIAEHKRRFNPNWTREVDRVLKVDILPHLKALRADAVAKADVVRAVEGVAGRGAFEAADNVLGLVRAIYNWGVGTGRLEHDPTRGLKKRNTGRPRERVLSDDEIRAVWRFSTEFYLAFRLKLVTAARIAEVLNATKSEFDLAGGVWTIPACRTKNRREHRLPLSSLALYIVKAATLTSGDSPWLFPSSADGKPLRTRSAAQALARLSKQLSIADAFTPHDLRRTCASRLGDLAIPDEVIGRILNHTPLTITGRIYNRSERWEEMRQALDAWAGQLGNLVGGL